MLVVITTKKSQLFKVFIVPGFFQVFLVRIEPIRERQTPTLYRLLLVPVGVELFHSQSPAKRD